MVEDNKKKLENDIKNKKQKFDEEIEGTMKDIISKWIQVLIIW